MRRLLFALSLVSAVPFAARAQGMKIGYVDVQRAVQEVEEGRQARARLKSELDQKRANLDQKRATLEKMKADYDKQVVTLSEEMKRKKQEELQKAFIEAQNEAQQMQEELSGKEQEAMSGISKRLLQVVAEVSDRESFTFVLDKAALLYAPAASDVTNEVVRRYNERFGAKGPAKTPPANNNGAKAPPANNNSNAKPPPPPPGKK